MRLTLIGMSGAGKSHWSRNLEKAGFRRLCCDDLIAVRLAPQLPPGRDRLHAMGTWLGLPDNPRYLEREAAYLNAEVDVLRRVLREGLLGDADPVLDTSGSVIYAPPELLTELRQATVVVHLATSPELRAQLLKAYVAKPRPVIWHGHYQPRPDEPRQDTVARCFHELMEAREAAYRQLAHLVVPPDHRAQRDFDLVDFILQNYR